MDRLIKLRHRLKEKGLDCLVVTSAENRRYLSGFTGSAGTLVITSTAALLLTDFRYVEQATHQSPEFTILRYDELIKTLGQVFTEQGAKRVGFEGDVVTYQQYADWQGKLGDVEWVATQEIVEELRMLKEATEIEAMERAAAIADTAWSQLLPRMVPGVSERELALELEFAMRRQGAEGLAFDVILASGPNGALPHARPGERVLAPGDLVVMDFGARYGGYCSDMTRTVCIGKACHKSRAIYDVVLEAQLSALAAVGPGKTGIEIDRVARQIIEEAGYGDQFGHGLGHGVGLAIHEEPRLSPKGNKTLKPGMVVTVEPGIYLPGFGGVRIEDLVLVTQDGYRVLSHSTKELLELN
ncbi:MAG: aminopeptidase P family protein [Firmicutes bacterium]|nr:aminopeptidase P family protein [Bacillota bacterium]